MANEFHTLDVGKIMKIESTGTSNSLLLLYDLCRVCMCAHTKLQRGFAKNFFPKIRDYYGSGSRSRSDFFLLENHLEIALNQC